MDKVKEKMVSLEYVGHAFRMARVESQVSHEAVAEVLCGLHLKTGPAFDSIRFESEPASYATLLESEARDAAL
jgi:hypothetical protein